MTEIPEPTPVVATQPSNAGVTPEAAPAVEAAPVSLEDAARRLVEFVHAGRRAGDGDVDAAVADVEAALDAAQA